MQYIGEIYMLQMAVILESKMAATLTFESMFNRFIDPEYGGIAQGMNFLAVLVFEILGKICF